VVSSPPVLPSPFSNVGEILPALGISKRRFKQIESICLIREQRSKGHQELAFNARPFVLCGLPLRRPPSTQLVHRRRNGKCFLHLVAHPDYGLPFGQDRLIPIWIATLAVKQRSRTARFESAIELLRFFRLPTDGRYYARIIEGFKRIFGATIFFGAQEQADGKPMIDCARFHFFDDAHLWFNCSEARIASYSAPQANAITLSESFYAEISQHPIPAEREAIALLANAPGALDFYVWLAWKSWAVRKGDVARVPLFGNNGLIHQLGCGEYSSDRFFRRKLCAWLRRVATIWPECPARLSDDGTCLLISPPLKATAIRMAQCNHEESSCSFSS
jgi:Plasmid encoded RepA protein